MCRANPNPSPQGEGLMPPPEPLHGSGAECCWRSCRGRWMPNRYKTNEKSSFSPSVLPGDRHTDQELPKTIPRGSQKAPRGTQDRPRLLQVTSGMPQDGRNRCNFFPKRFLSFCNCIPRLFCLHLQCNSRNISKGRQEAPKACPKLTLIA